MNSQKSWPMSWAPKPNISISTMKTYQECPRKYWYDNAPTNVKNQFPRHYKLERNIAPDNMLIGSIVDETIKRDLRHYNTLRSWSDDLNKTAKLVFNEILDFSRDYLDIRDNPNRKIPFEDINPQMRIYYGEDYSEVEIQAKLSQVSNHLERYVRSDFRGFMETHSGYCWEIPRSITERPVPWFIANGMPIYASYDFIMYSEDRSHGYVIDWKTGRRTDESVESALDQMHIYAAFMNSYWHVPLDNIYVGAVWLESDGMPEFKPVDIVRIDGTYQKLSRHFSLISAKVAEGETADRLGRDVFPETTSEKTCLYCKYRSCNGYKKAFQRRMETHTLY